MTAEPIRLLLLEDNPGDARLVQTALADHAPGGFSVTWVERLAEALARIQTETFDVVLCDLGLPDSTGLATAQAIAARAPGLALVVLTGSHNEDLGRAAIQRGAQDYLVKGEAEGALIARTLRYAIERKRLEIGLRTANEALERRVAERTTELETANTSLRESVTRYRAVTQTATDAIITATAAGAIVGWNAGAARIFGYVEAEVLGQSLTLLMPQRFRDTHSGGMHRLQAGGERRVIGKTVELHGLSKAGDEFPIELSLSAWETPEGQCVTGIIRDITERKGAEEEIRRYVAQLETAFMSTVQVATTLSEMRDPYTAGHERRVAHIAIAIGAELGFDARRRDGLRVAGHLHDVGKITIPSEILSKPGKLSSIEFKLIQGHAQASYDVLKEVEFPWPVAEAVLQHHERLNGSGYPRGLKAEEICLEARILAVADTVEAMASHRPYRSALGIGKALAEIERGRGTSYDPVVADACVKLFREKSYVIPT